MIGIGDKFPNFKLKGAYNDKEIEIESKDLKGKWVIVFFYPEDFSFICPTEVISFNEHLTSFEKNGAKIYGISIDDVQMHKEWIKELKIEYPLLSDEGGKLSQKIGILDAEDNRSHRATFILNPELKVESIMINSKNVGRSVDETLRVFLNLLSGNMCPANYDPRTLKEL